MGYQNFYSSKISNDIGAGDNTITVDNAPASTSGRMVLEARNPTQREIIKYTSVSGNILQGVTRGQGGTSAKSHLKGALIQQNATAEDLQDLYDAFASFSAANNDWRTLVATLNSVTYNGNRSYDLVFNGTDLTGTLSPGMRLRTTRTVAAPTQCTSLNGTSQYYSKSSPAAMTFNDDFVVSAWVKLSSYASGAIAGRYNGTSGWYMNINASGQVVLTGFNAGAGNYSSVNTYQSVPLNKWVHVSAQLDMSAFTATTTTSYVMIDGVDVPVVVSRGGTNPTALAQPVADLQIGAANSTLFFPGKIAQVAIYNAKVTQANIKATISQGLSGSETSLISAYSFNNSINDLNTTNANNLTANGSAVATNADSPFGGQASGLISSTLDYAIIQSATFSTNTTLVVQVPEGCTIPTSGGVSAVSYSTQKTPYGFPTQRSKWRINVLNKATIPTVSNASYQPYSQGAYSLTVPVGEWYIGGSGDFYNVSATTTVFCSYTAAALTGVTSTATAANLAPLSFRILGSGTGNASPWFMQKPQQTITTPTVYKLYSIGGTTSAGIDGATVTETEFFADNAYL